MGQGLLREPRLRLLRQPRHGWPGAGLAAVLHARAPGDGPHGRGQGRVRGAGEPGLCLPRHHGGSAESVDALHAGRGVAGRPGAAGGPRSAGPGEGVGGGRAERAAA